MNTEPLLATERDFVIRFVVVVGFDDVHVLDAERVTTPQHSTDIVCVKHVLQDHCDTAYALLKDFREPLPSGRCQHAQEVVAQGTFRVCQMRQGAIREWGRTHRSLGNRQLVGLAGVEYSS